MVHIKGKKKVHSLKKKMSRARLLMLIVLPSLSLSHATNHVNIFRVIF
jgi:hypothetical protein